MIEIAIIISIIVALFGCGFAFGFLLHGKMAREKNEKIGAELMPTESRIPRPQPDHEYRPRSPYAPRRPQPPPKLVPPAEQPKTTGRLPPINWGSA
jgi:hypothetical protein